MTEDAPDFENEIEDEPEPVRRGREAMRGPVADFADPAKAWHLVVQCAGSCRVQRRLVADLVPLVPPGLTWAKVMPKLRCSQCGEPADIIGLIPIRLELDPLPTRKPAEADRYRF